MGFWSGRTMGLDMNNKSSRILAYQQSHLIPDHELKNIAGGTGRITFEPCARLSNSVPGSIDVEIDQYWDQ